VDHEIFLGDELAKERNGQLSHAIGATHQALHGKLESAVKAAGESLAAAKEARKKEMHDAARELFTRAFFLDTAAANGGASAGVVAAEALAALEELRAHQVKSWLKEVPQLSKKLDLVIRDQSIEQALAQVGKAAGLSITILPGSLTDAATLTGTKEPRVAYLDLRRATVAEALDWLAQAERLNWWTSKEGVTVGSERRRTGQSAWVYDVSLIALPDGAELQKLGDFQKAVAAAEKEANEFSDVVRRDLGASASDHSVAWFAPGQLLVIGTPEQHTKAEKLLANLSDGSAKLRGPALALQKITAKRFAERKEQAERTAKARALFDVAKIHERFGWQLLAAAAAGSVDLEALSELQIAWQRPETSQLLKGDARMVVLRSWWILNEALAAVGTEDEELSALAQSARRACESAVENAVQSLQKNQNDAGAFAAVLYSALAMRDEEFTKRVIPLLTKPMGDDTRLAAARTIAAALLTDSRQTHKSELTKTVENGVAGDDLTALLAFACKRTDREIWNAYRAAASDLIGEQQLDGNVVVLVNRLSAAAFPAVMQ
jgi:hypothetical protein